MNSAGNVRWRTRLPRPAIALEIDPLGRYVIHGHATGEIVRLDLFGPAPGSERAAETAGGTASGARPRTRGRNSGSGGRRGTDLDRVGPPPRLDGAGGAVRGSRPRRRCWRSPRIPRAWRRSPVRTGCSFTARPGRSSVRGLT